MAELTLRKIFEELIVKNFRIEYIMEPPYQKSWIDCIIRRQEKKLLVKECYELQANIDQWIELMQMGVVKLQVGLEESVELVQQLRMFEDGMQKIRNIRRSFTIIVDQQILDIRLLSRLIKIRDVIFDVDLDVKDQRVKEIIGQYKQTI